jgi:hypothetical protein
MVISTSTPALLKLLCHSRAAHEVRATKFLHSDPVWTFPTHEQWVPHREINYKDSKRQKRFRSGIASPEVKVTSVTLEIGEKKDDD